MKIYTKTGDKGTTSLLGGTRVSKSHDQIEAYGTVDELNSYIGLIRDQISNELIKKELISIQDRLFTLGAHLANDGKKEKIKIPPLFESNILDLETSIDNMEKDLPTMTHFILPGGNSIVSFVHIARCIARRAERLVVKIDNHNLNPLITQYLNRLSDYLFVLARKMSQELGAREIKWEPKH